MKLTLLLTVLAGSMNGSFTIFVRFLKRLNVESIWFFHSLVGLIGISWAIFFVMMPDQIFNYKSLSFLSLVWMLGGGFVFGLGHLLFARAIISIGVAPSFSINLGLSVVVGSFFLMILNGRLLTWNGFIVLISVCLIVIGLFYYYLSVKEKSQLQSTFLFKRGCLFAMLAGISSGLQNITFVIVSFHSSSNFLTDNSYWFWPPFLTVAAIVMMFGFRYQLNKKSCKITIPTCRELSIIVTMGLLFSGSIAFYSLVMNHTSHLGKEISWPLFMVSIILTSQLWGIIFSEIDFSDKAIKWRVSFSMCLMIVAIVLLATQRNVI
jgi:L-rhamnose-H+ transport protein